ncbi:glucose-1-phosphate adenylyltransferase [Clostridium formicaceticum]|uniref:Glucose-1-phosphate adenylyltransferase n=1 Tax=Clostridium formicaceticum TaxID=1497 RepID=A0AAC9RQG2_9CLOT|nr:glucose-1-phosphate adenylyltransferase [Clostridium formicaceticum]AOY74894.1 glucose-1-phosphate adenylyltransferase [Clostridium formicaceticum]ARE89298.1 Glucose-1-phosphate adenylyltransferase [Clostridium formicaceticum]
MKQECVAMLLAGGQGSRLGILTENIAKPAIPFGGKYRIIDFTLSNCSNSGIDTLGVLTQYEPLILNAYIGVGSPWDLDKQGGGVTLLPPYVRSDGGDWYRGTANAVYQNIGYIDSYNPKYVMILSGDHIYKMDYSFMLKEHKRNNADATISVIEVPWEETHRFGIMNTNEKGRIIEFQEKPKKAISNLASMGVYIFNWKKLKKHLIEDEGDKKSQNDFGKNIIPKMLREGEKLYAYPFGGYWKDVGTIESFWQANMDLLLHKSPLNIFDKNWMVYSVNVSQPPQYIAASGSLRNALVTDGCQIFGEIHNTVVFTGAYIGEGTVIKDSVIMANAYIGAGVSIEKAIIGEDAMIEDDVIIGIGSSQEKKITVIGQKIHIAKGTHIDAGAHISKDNCSMLKPKNMMAKEGA